jgi:DNA-binding FadR family transcriptional regulator
VSRLVSPKLHQLVVQQLARDLVSGRIMVGDELPPELGLAERFEVSKPVIRAAIQDLESCGMLRTRHGKRTIVTPRQEWEILDERIQMAFREENLAGELISSLYELRQMFEPQVAEWAAERADDADREYLGQLMERMTDSLTQSDPVTAFLVDDREFHAAIAQASKNLLVSATMKALHNVVTTSWATSVVGQSDLAALLAQHTEIAEAIGRRDGTGAHEAMARHLTWAMRRELAPATG